MGGSQLQHEKVTQVIEEWSWYANVTFKEASSAEESNVRVTFDTNDGNWSYIGRQCDSTPVKEATMNLASVDEFSSITVNEKAVILHEFGHALGLLHEHQSPAHGNKAVQNIDAAFKLYEKIEGWTGEQISDHVINVYNKSDITNYAQVDIHSIMHYPQPKELTGLDVDIPFNGRLSDLDKAYMILQYPRKTMHPEAAKAGWSIEKALKVIGAPTDVTDKVLTFVEDKRDESGQISAANIREVIGNWIRATHGLVEDGGQKLPPSLNVQPPTAGPSYAENANKPAINSFIYQLYDKLSTLYCSGGGQYFALQFPTRYLDKDTFAYELNRQFSRFTKPVAVAEAEFNLTDDLYAPSPIVGGPNGQRLSQTYSKALNSLIPTSESSEVQKQREKMRKWLLKEAKPGNAAYSGETRSPIPGSNQGRVNDLPQGMTRMEYSDSLMQAYLRDRQEWEERRNKIIYEASSQADMSPQAMEDLTRRLANIGTLEEAKLSAKYADAVVRGYRHTVRGFLGHLDVKSVAESLQDAKDSFRQSALSSLYTASKVYPVAMQPTDWFQALDTGFTREELSQDPFLISAAITAKAQFIDSLQNQIANLRGFQKGDPEAVKAAVNEAAALRDIAIAELSRKYTASTISAVNLVITAVAGPAEAAGAGIASATIGKIMQKSVEDEDKKKLLTAGISEDDLADIGKQMDEVAKANAAVNSASRALTEHMSDYSLAMAGRTCTMVDEIQQQLTTAKQELSELQQSYTIANRKKATSADGKLEDIGKLPPSNEGSRWSEIHVQSNVPNSYTKTTSEAESKVENFDCNFWIGSCSQSHQESQAKNTAESGSSTLNVDVSLRVTNITVDRSAWFDPSLLEMSKSFMKTSNSAPWSTWKTGSEIEDAVKAITDNNQEKKPEGYLVAYPVGYIIVKDCVIKVSSSSQNNDIKESINKQSQSSSGFLCFSSRPSLDSGSSSTTSASDGVVIRIPGPQILGYVMQLTGEDNSQSFSEVPMEDLFPEDFEEVSALPSGTPAQERTVRSCEEDPATTPQSFTTGRPRVSANDVQGPGDIMDALRQALEDGEFADWAAKQPEGVEDEIMAKVREAFGKAAEKK